jgi:N-carbamoyl-L-amino-acid hydrolase
MYPGNLRINADRLQSNLEYLSSIGKTDGGGVHRPTFSATHFQARDWFRQRAKDAGLDFQVDSAGNHGAILHCGSTHAPTLLIGSHLDSVPNGGRFDGALGVMAAFEALQTIQEAKLSLPFNLEAIDFTDEEGTLVGLLGSSAMAGKLSQADLLEPRGGRENLLNALAAADLTEEGLVNATRDFRSLAGYLELHIEQGSQLYDSNTDIGIVSSIVGIGSYQIAFIGRANHAGTTSMQARLDATQGASAFALAVRKLVIKEFSECVANIGNMTFEPGAFNIIPQRVVTSLEYRAPTQSLLDRLETALLNLARDQAERFGLGLETEFLGKHLPALMNDDIQAIFRQAAKVMKLRQKSISSGAGHDAQSFADICPTGMIFVPSFEGISHSPREFTTWQDCINGANILLLAVLIFASQFSPN